MNPIAITNGTRREGSPHADAESLRETIAAVREDRSLGKVRFSATSVSAGGVATRCLSGPLVQGSAKESNRLGRFEWGIDEPAALLGTDTGANPAEYLLGALAGCYTVTLTQLAALKGIELSRIDLDLTFDLDLAGFLGLDASVRPGAAGIGIDVSLDSPTASATELEELVRATEQASPIGTRWPTRSGWSRR